MRHYTVYGIYIYTVYTYGLYDLLVYGLVRPYVYVYYTQYSVSPNPTYTVYTRSYTPAIPINTQTPNQV
jgi:hypothetical protein